MYLFPDWFIPNAGAVFPNQFFLFQLLELPDVFEDEHNLVILFGSFLSNFSSFAANIF
jgi:hypothetical protein